jgi:hypothetical protein
LRFLHDLQANINPKISTVEELQSRRKTLHCGNAALLRRDLVLQAKEGLQTFLDIRGKTGSNVLEVVCGLPGQVHIEHSTNIVTFFDWQVPAIDCHIERAKSF